jgi:ElaB/YqjD/DUF883 family membrane-anchored ribosome-binding protein
MSKQSHGISDQMSTLADDARELLSVTADVAGEKVGQARKRLAVALDRSKEIYGSVRDKVVDGAKAADDAVRERPYHAIAVGVGVGAILGFLIARQCSRNRD